MEFNYLITVTTLTLNNTRDLEFTYESIVNLNFPKDKVEFLVLDSSSKKIFHKNQIFINKFRNYGYKIIHKYQKPNGIYSAMNESISLASGEFIIFMNSGDCFYKEFNIYSVLNAIREFKYLDNKFQINLIYGRAKVISTLNKKISWIQPPLSINPSKKIFWNLLTPPMHQACFFRRSWHLKNYYLLNSGYKSDQIVKKKGIKSAIFIDQIICNYYLSGISSMNNLAFNKIIAISFKTKSIRYFLTNIFKFLLIIIFKDNWEYFRKFKTIFLSKFII